MLERMHTLGWFGSKEALTTGDLVIRIDVEPQPFVMFTLDAPDAGGHRTWYSGVAGATLTGNEQNADEIVQMLMISGMAVVRKKVPSLQSNPLQVRLDESNGKTEVVGSGSVQFLRSEWHAATRPRP